LSPLAPQRGGTKLFRSRGKSGGRIGSFASAAGGWLWRARCKTSDGFSRAGAVALPVARFAGGVYIVPRGGMAPTFVVVEPPIGDARGVVDRGVAAPPRRVEVAPGVGVSDVDALLPVEVAPGTVELGRRGVRVDGVLRGAALRGAPVVPRALVVPPGPAVPGVGVVVRAPGVVGRAARAAGEEIGRAHV
jgi:hypothetical protein